MKLLIKKFRVRNYRNIDDSDWIPVENVTAFVGRNESGKTALLKALHKFNPAIPEPYHPQREFPRDRFTREFEDGGEWPVCDVEFELSETFRDELRETLDGVTPPTSVIFTRYYDGSLTQEYDTRISDEPVDPTSLVNALNTFAKSARRLNTASPEQEEQINQLRTDLVQWVANKTDVLKGFQDLRTDSGNTLLRSIRDEANARSHPLTADMIETLFEVLEPVIEQAEVLPLPERLDEAVFDELPVFIYFENYGILDSAVYLPRFLEDLGRTPNNARIRTVNAMFKHVRLTAEEIASLGNEKTAEARRNSQQITPEMIAQDQETKELRAVKLNSASLDITKRFTEWYGQRRHKIRYDADGDYFRIWISDDRRPDVEIELESRSKGFQWFFSFYLVFLVESEEGHKDSILLLDEPGLSLHPTAQQELIAFFERLSERHPLIYTTHSPFLVDGEHIHRVRPVTEDDTGHSRINLDGWPNDRETIFPLQAAAGYAMVRGLFQHKKNILVEGMSDYLYLHSLNLHCKALGRTSLPDDIYITPCGGTKMVGHLASLFLGQNVRPIVLLDGDDAGRARQNALMKELYAGYDTAVLMLSDVLGQTECETEDIIGEDVYLPVASVIADKRITLNKDDRTKGSLVDQVKAATSRHQIELPDGWKAEVARQLSVTWATTNPEDMPEDVLNRAETLFLELNKRFDKLN